MTLHCTTSTNSKWGPQRAHSFLIRSSSQMKEKLMHLSTYCLNKNIEVLVLTNEVKKEREKNTKKMKSFFSSKHIIRWASLCWWKPWFLECKTPFKLLYLSRQRIYSLVYTAYPNISFKNQWWRWMLLRNGYPRHT